MEKSNLQILTNGIIKENPVLVLVLGTCPTMAVTTMAKNGIGMGLAATFVLLGSNIVISLLKKVIPDKVRIPCYIVVIAGFVTLLSALLQAYATDIYNALGIFLPLIVVNCIILGRAEMFASKNSVLKSALDGIGMGIGFTLALLIIGSIREILGSGTWMAGLGELIPALGKDFVIQVLPESIDPFTIMTSAPGGFFVFGCLMALVIWIEIKTNNRKVRSIGCEGCPSASVCGGKCADKAEGGEA